MITIGRKYLKEDEECLWQGRAYPNTVFDLTTASLYIPGIALFFLLGGYLCFTKTFWTNFELWRVGLLLPGIYFILTPLRFKLAMYFSTYAMTSKRFVVVENYILFRRIYSLSFNDVNGITLYFKKNFITFRLGSYKRWWDVKEHSASGFCFYLENRDVDHFLLFLPKERLCHVKKISKWNWDLVLWDSPENTGIYAPELLKGAFVKIEKDPAFTSGGPFSIPH